MICLDNKLFNHRDTENTEAEILLLSFESTI
jgi:hypothetical protein